MAQAPTATRFLPQDLTLPSLAAAAAACRGCDLYRNATQTVFGEGDPVARVMLVGEQPGDREDTEGHPFVGPAGAILSRALDDLEVAHDDVYITNAVKHFKWKPRGKRRIHEKPRAAEIRACRPWLEAEIDVVKPGIIACLGTTAVFALLGNTARVTADRGRILESSYGPCLVTTHPSSILRIEDSEDRAAAYEAFLQDLRNGLKFLERSKA